MLPGQLLGSSHLDSLRQADQRPGAGARQQQQQPSAARLRRCPQPASPRPPPPSTSSLRRRRLLAAGPGAGGRSSPARGTRAAAAPAARGPRRPSGPPGRASSRGEAPAPAAGRADPKPTNVGASSGFPPFLLLPEGGEKKKLPPGSSGSTQILAAARPRSAPAPAGGASSPLSSSASADPAAAVVVAAAAQPPGRSPPPRAAEWARWRSAEGPRRPLRAPGSPHPAPLLRALVYGSSSPPLGLRLPHAIPSSPTRAPRLAPRAAHWLPPHPLLARPAPSPPPPPSPAARPFLPRTPPPPLLPSASPSPAHRAGPAAESSRAFPATASPARCGSGAPASYESCGVPERPPAFGATVAGLGVLRARQMTSGKRFELGEWVGNLSSGRSGRLQPFGWGARRIETREMEAKRMEPLQKLDANPSSTRAGNRVCKRYYVMESRTLETPPAKLLVN